jgi:asparagine synthase (glutamine-hydrolysing)
MPWLRPAAEKRALALLRTRQAAVPVRCNHAITAQSTHRCFTGAAGTFRALGEALGTTTDQPQLRPGVVESFAGACGWRGFANLRGILEQLAGDLLPADLLVERPAPHAIGVFFGARSREFATSWTGGGLDESIVDVDTLRQNWLSDRPDPRTACLLQYAWLTEQLAGASCPGTTTDELILTHQHN